MKLVRIGDLEMNVVDRGQGGIPLLFVHGFPLDHSMWKGQLDEFAEHGRVIAPDLRGFGQTTVTSGVATMEQQADDLAALLEALEVREPVVFCGLSMGGYIAWQFWRRHAARVRGLVLCDTRAIADTPEGAAGRLKLAERALTEGSTPVADAMLPKLFWSETAQRQPSLIEDTRRVILGTKPEGIAAALRGMAQRPEVTTKLPTIEVPSLVIVGEHDAIATVDEMRTIADAIPDAGWVVVPEAGHMAPLENPAVFNQALTEYLTL